MTEQRARELVGQHGCTLLRSDASSLLIVNERVNFRYQCFISTLAGISEEHFIHVLKTGHTPKGVPSLPGVYRDHIQLKRGI